LGKWFANAQPQVCRALCATAAMGAVGAVTAVVVVMMMVVVVVVVAVVVVVTDTIFCGGVIQVHSSYNFSSR
jgi:hypothetical protein